MKAIAALESRVFSIGGLSQMLAGQGVVATPGDGAVVIYRPRTP